MTTHGWDTADTVSQRITPMRQPRWLEKIRHDPDDWANWPDWWQRFWKAGKYRPADGHTDKCMDQHMGES